MNVTIFPSEISGSVRAPSSKSMAHRLLIAAGFSEGRSRIRGLTMSEDILATMDCLRALGASVEVSGDDADVTGADPRHAAPGLMDARESGSTLRFLIPAAMLTEQEAVFTGRGRLLDRPLDLYEDIFRKDGMKITRQGDHLHIRSGFSGGDYTVDGSISSQFISGMLFALPLHERGGVLHLIPPVESRPYIDMTVQALREFGLELCWKDDVTIDVPGGQSYRAHDVTVEGDWSGAAFLLALGADVTGLDPASIQGDKICREYFRLLDEGRAEVDITDCPDLGPVLMAYAAMRHGAVLTGTSRLRIKESDRGAAMKEELTKFGVTAEIEDNRIIIGSGAHCPDGILGGHNDHRIVMALAVMCAGAGGTIEGAEAVSKSFPDFFERIGEIGVRYEYGI